MRIIDSRKDYYDCVQRSGFDNTIVYLRKEIESTVCTYNRVLNQNPIKNKDAKKWGDLFNESFYRNWRNGNEFYGCKYELEFCVIGFCGQLYPSIFIEYEDEENLVKNKSFTGPKFIPEKIKTHLYKIDDIDNIVVKVTPKKYIKHYEDNIRPKILNFFNNCKTLSKKDDYVKIFTENKCPIFVVCPNRYHDQYTIILNPILNGFQFYRVFDINQAYQEIFMYMANFAREFKPVPVIDDENKILTHGFNKFSFRKDPTKIRKKRK